MDKIREFLSTAGWKEGHIECYLTILQYGALSAPELDDRLDMTERTIRRKLQSLLKKGALTETEGTARGQAQTYEAQHPRFVLDEVMEKLNSLRQDALAEVEPLWENRASKQERWPDRTVHGPSGYNIAVKEQIDQACERILVVDGQLKWLTVECVKTLETRRDTVADVRVLTDGNESVQEARLEAKEFNLRSAEELDSTFVIVDDTVIIFNQREQTVIITRNESSASIFLNEFESLWTKTVEGDEVEEATIAADAD